VCALRVASRPRSLQHATVAVRGTEPELSPTQEVDRSAQSSASTPEQNRRTCRSLLTDASLTGCGARRCHPAWRAIRSRHALACGLRPARPRGSGCRASMTVAPRASMRRGLVPSLPTEATRATDATAAEYEAASPTCSAPLSPTDGFAPKFDAADSVPAQCPVGVLGAVSEPRS
jgi:hypothetical protein